MPRKIHLRWLVPHRATGLTMTRASLDDDSTLSFSMITKGSTGEKADAPPLAPYGAIIEIICFV